MTQRASGFDYRLQGLGLGLWLEGGHVEGEVLHKGQHSFGRQVACSPSHSMPLKAGDGEAHLLGSQRMRETVTAEGESAPLSPRRFLNFT